MEDCNGESASGTEEYSHYRMALQYVTYPKRTLGYTRGVTRQDSPSTTHLIPPFGGSGIGLGGNVSRENALARLTQDMLEESEW